MFMAHNFHFIPSREDLGCAHAVVYPRRFPLPQFGGRTGNGFAKGAWETSSERGERRVQSEGEAMAPHAGVCCAGDLPAARRCGCGGFLLLQRQPDKLLEEEKMDGNWNTEMPLLAWDVLGLRGRGERLQRQSCALAVVSGPRPRGTPRCPRRDIGERTGASGTGGLGGCSVFPRQGSPGSMAASGQLPSGQPPKRVKLTQILEMLRMLRCGAGRRILHRSQPSESPGRREHVLLGWGASRCRQRG